MPTRAGCQAETGQDGRRLKFGDSLHYVIKCEQRLPNVALFRPRRLLAYVRLSITNVHAYAGPISPAGRLISTGERPGDGP